MTNNYQIQTDIPTRPEIVAILERHLDLMRSLSPPESMHALDISGLEHPHIQFWSISHEDTKIGVGALAALSGLDDKGQFSNRVIENTTDAEIKSMHIISEYRGQGAAQVMLEYILDVAKISSIQRVWLETGSQDGFEPARRLYASYGFQYCGPFASYSENPNSVFMRLELDS